MEASRLSESLRRGVGVAYGFACQGIFLITVWCLFWYLRDGALHDAHGAWVWWDLLLAGQFAVLHSLMLYPKIKRWLCQWIPSAFYDSTFCLVTCVSLLALFWGWRTSEQALWVFEGWQATAVHLAFYASWAALFYSLALTGLGYQTGWTPFYYWLRRQAAPRRAFEVRGAYRLIRHPVYLSFLGLIWFTPRMTWDHAVLTAVWTGYIFYGSYLKDRRLEFYVGDAYRAYRRRVPGFPWLRLGWSADDRSRSVGSIVKQRHGVISNGVREVVPDGADLDRVGEIAWTKSAG